MLKSHARTQKFVLSASVLVLALGGLSAAEPSKPATGAPAKAPEASLGLKVGDKAPSAMVLTPGGPKMDLAELYSKGPIVVSFYRGGWCPYCTKSLDAFNQSLADMKAQGASFVAITPDRPENVQETTSDYKLQFITLTDHEGNAARAFNVLFDLAPDIQEKYKGYGVDLAKRNADGKWNLPHPATYVIDQQGMIRYAYVNADYTKRADPAEVVAALKEIASEKK